MAGWEFLAVAAAYDAALFALALVDYVTSEKRGGLEVGRSMDERFSLGAENRVEITARNVSRRRLVLRLKDEFPNQLRLTGERECSVSLEVGEWLGRVRALPDPARELRVRRCRAGFADASASFGERCVGRSRNRSAYIQISTKRTRTTSTPSESAAPCRETPHAVQRTGREFESMREFVNGRDPSHRVAGDGATRQIDHARVHRRAQSERGRDARYGAPDDREDRRAHEARSPINAALSIAYVALAGGDNVGAADVRAEVTYLPPNHRRDQLSNVIEALYAIEPGMIEPSYARAFNYLGANCRRRSLVVILTDLVDEEGHPPSSSPTRGC